MNCVIFFYVVIILMSKGSKKEEEHNETVKSLEQLSQQRQTELKEKIKSLQAQHCQAIDFLQKQLLESRSEAERVGKLVDELKSSGRVEKESLSGQTSPVGRRNGDSLKLQTSLLIKVENDSEV